MIFKNQTKYSTEYNRIASKIIFNVEVTLQELITHTEYNPTLTDMIYFLTQNKFPNQNSIPLDDLIQTIDTLRTLYLDRTINIIGDNVILV